MARCPAVLGFCLLFLLLLPAAVLGEDCEAYTDDFGQVQPAQSCPQFCCGFCWHRYCCSHEFLKFDKLKVVCNQFDERVPDIQESLDALKKNQEELSEALSNSWLG